MAWHLPPSPAKHPDLQLSASLCNTILLGKDGFGMEGEKKDGPGVFTHQFSIVSELCLCLALSRFWECWLCTLRGLGRQAAVQSNTRGVRAEPELFSLCSHRA